MAGLCPMVPLTVYQCSKKKPPLGTKMSEPVFTLSVSWEKPSQYKLRVKKDGGMLMQYCCNNYSRAYCDALQRGLMLW
jgi:hypothetical protein